MRSLCELEGIPVQMANEEFTGVWFLRETRALVDWLRERGSRLVSNADLQAWLTGQISNAWIELLQEAVSEYALETGDSETPVEGFIEWLAEWGRDIRGQQRGLLLLTAHRAKGLEFNHVVVLDGDWSRIGRDEDAPRRLYYVAMTRAKETLMLMRLPGSNPFLDILLSAPQVLFRSGPATVPSEVPELARSYRRFSLGDVFLSFAGYRPPGDPVHGAIAALSPGDNLHVRQGSPRWELLDQNGVVVGQLARGSSPPSGMHCEYATVLAIVRWDRERSEPQYQANLRAVFWEAVVPELIFKPDS